MPGDIGNQVIKKSCDYSNKNEIEIKTIHVGLPSADTSKLDADQILRKCFNSATSEIRVVIKT